MRDELERRAHAVSEGLEPIRAQQLLDVEGRFGVCSGQLCAEEKEPDGCAERLTRLEPALVHCQVGCGEGDPPAPESLFDPFGRVPGVEEPRPQCGGNVGVELCDQMTQAASG